MWEVTLNDDTVIKADNFEYRRDFVILKKYYEVKSHSEKVRGYLWWKKEKIEFNETREHGFCYVPLATVKIIWWIKETEEKEKNEKAGA